MIFEKALSALKEGASAYRVSWKNTLHISLLQGGEYESIKIESFFVVRDICKSTFYIWFPTSSDLLAEDWIVSSKVTFNSIDYRQPSTVH